MNPSSSQQLEHFHHLLKEFHTAMLVTHASGGSLRARPMAVADLEENGRLWFITELESGKTAEIESDSRVLVVCQKDRSVYLSVEGTARLVADRARIEEVWQEAFKVWFPKGKEDPNIALIAVDPISGEFWDNEGLNKIQYLFESVKAYATGTKPHVEEGEQHGAVSFE